MQAAVYTEHGGPEVLSITDVPQPEPGYGEVLLRLRAAALNRLDLWVREGWPGLKLTFPHIPGADGAGEITALGEGVHGFEIGDRVVLDANIGCGQCRMCLAGQDNLCVDWELAGETIPGTLAEYIAVPARNLMLIPEHFEYAPAAAASLVFLTSWHSLITRGRLRAGETVLVIGASGGVNLASIQIAKYAGAEVIVLGSSEEKLALAETFGADTLINRREHADWHRVVRHYTGQQGVDVIVNNVGGETMQLSLKAAAKRGRILTVGNTGRPVVELDNRFIFGKHLSIIGSTMSPLEDFQTVMQLVFEGKLRVALDRRYPLKDTGAALERLESGKQLGKIVIDFPV